MKKVKEIMTRELVTLSPEMDIAKAAGILLEKRINGAPVVDGKNKVIGILCQSDLISTQKRFPVPSLFTLLDGLIPLKSEKKIEKELHKMAAVTVADAMTKNPICLNPESSVEEAATLMVEKNFHTLPVLQDTRLVGVVGKEDVLKLLAG